MACATPRCPRRSARWCCPPARRTACSCRSRAGRRARCDSARDRRSGAAWARCRHRGRRAGRRRACPVGCPTPRSTAGVGPRLSVARFDTLGFRDTGSAARSSCRSYPRRDTAARMSSRHHRDGFSSPSGQPRLKHGPTIVSERRSAEQGWCTPRRFALPGTDWAMVSGVKRLVRPAVIECGLAHRGSTMSLVSNSPATKPPGSSRTGRVKERRCKAFSRGRLRTNDLLGRSLPFERRCAV